MGSNKADPHRGTHFSSTLYGESCLNVERLYRWLIGLLDAALIPLLRSSSLQNGFNDLSLRYLALTCHHHRTPGISSHIKSLNEASVTLNKW